MRALRLSDRSGKYFSKFIIDLEVRFIDVWRVCEWGFCTQKLCTDVTCGGSGAATGIADEVSSYENIAFCVLRVRAVGSLMPLALVGATVFL